MQNNEVNNTLSPTVSDASVDFNSSHEKLFSASVRRSLDDSQQKGKQEPKLLEKKESLLSKRCGASPAPVLKSLLKSTSPSNIHVLAMKRQSQSQSHSHGLHSGIKKETQIHSRDVKELKSNSQVNVPVQAQRRGVAPPNGIRLRIASKKEIPKSKVLVESRDIVLTPKEKSLPATEEIKIKNEKVWKEYSTSEKDEYDEMERKNSSEGVINHKEMPLICDWNTSRNSSSGEKSENSSERPRYQVPSVEERMRAIKEQREQRLEKIHQKLMEERANIIAPRPKTLLRVRRGGYKSIEERRSRAPGNGVTPLTIEDCSNDIPLTTGIYGSEKGSLFSSGVSSPSSTSCFAPGVSHTQLQEQYYQNQNMENLNKEDLPLDIDKDD